MMMNNNKKNTYCCERVDCLFVQLMFFTRRYQLLSPKLMFNLVGLIRKTAASSSTALTAQTVAVEDPRRGQRRV